MRVMPRLLLALNSSLDIFKSILSQTNNVILIINCLVPWHLRGHGLPVLSSSIGLLYESFLSRLKLMMNVSSKISQFFLRVVVF